VSSSQSLSSSDGRGSEWNAHSFSLTVRPSGGLQRGGISIPASLVIHDFVTLQVSHPER
jgi:hypothetical protein